MSRTSAPLLSLLPVFTACAGGTDDSADVLAQEKGLVASELAPSEELTDASVDTATLEGDKKFLPYRFATTEDGGLQGCDATRGPAPVVAGTSANEAHYALLGCVDQAGEDPAHPMASCFPGASYTDYGGTHYLLDVYWTGCVHTSSDGTANDYVAQTYFSVSNLALAGAPTTYFRSLPFTVPGTDLIDPDPTDGYSDYQVWFSAVANDFFLPAALVGRTQTLVATSTVGIVGQYGAPVTNYGLTVSPSSARFTIRGLPNRDTSSPVK